MVTVCPRAWSRAMSRRVSRSESWRLPKWSALRTEGASTTTPVTSPLSGCAAGPVGGVAVSV